MLGIVRAGEVPDFMRVGLRVIKLLVGKRLHQFGGCAGQLAFRVQSAHERFDREALLFVPVERRETGSGSRRGQG